MIRKVESHVKSPEISLKCLTKPLNSFQNRFFPPLTPIKSILHPKTQKTTNFHPFFLPCHKKQLHSAFVNDFFLLNQTACSKIRYYHLIFCHFILMLMPCCLFRSVQIQIFSLNLSGFVFCLLEVKRNILTYHEKQILLLSPLSPLRCMVSKPRRNRFLKKLS